MVQFHLETTMENPYNDSIYEWTDMPSDGNINHLEHLMRIIDITNFVAIFVNIAGILCNLVVMFTLCKLRTKRKSYFYLVKSLAVADMLVSLLYLMDVVDNQFLHLQGFRQTFVDSHVPVATMWFNTAQMYAGAAVLFHLIMLAIEHTSAIFRPLQYNHWSQQRYINFRLLLIWTLPSFVILVPVGDILKLYVACSYTMIIFIALIGSSCLIMSLVYTALFLKVIGQRNTKGQRKIKNKKGLFTTVFIFSSFFVCWMPYMVCWSMTWLEVMAEYIRILTYTTSNFTCLNSVCDPLIYTWRLATVRKTLRRIFCCSFKSKSLRDELTKC